MARRKTITDKIRSEVVFLYEKTQSYTKTADALDMAISTVRKIYLDAQNNPELCKLMKNIKKQESESNEKLLDAIKSTQYANITKNAMALLTPDNLGGEVERYGIRGLITLIGNSVDKTLAIEDMELKKRAMVIREREIELKEKELELRISNPEAFHTVQIINDAPKEDERYASTHQ